MHLFVIGASGKSGKIFTQIALQEGHTITAGVRDTKALQPQNGLRIVQCDATSISQVLKYVPGHDAVISLIGHVQGSPPDLQTQAIKNIVNAMRMTGVSRLVSLTGTGVRMPGDHITMIDRLISGGVAKIDPDRVHDGQNHAEALIASAADWTILRVMKLVNSKPHPFSLTENGPGKLIVSRYEVANAILQILTQNAYIRKAPVISKPIS